MNSTSNASENTVNVDLGSQSYPIHIGAGFLERLSACLAEELADEHAVVITDTNVSKLYLSSVEDQLSFIASRIDTITVDAGEASKSVAMCDRLWQEMTKRKTDRKSVVVALGGGVVGDLAGFLAATYGRGLRFIQIPTTLLAQVDSSVGGKVGINLPQSKNMVGAFWQPQSVVIDPLVLSTLTPQDYQSGMAEVIKYGLIMDAQLFEFLEQSVDQIKQQDADTLAKMIAWCCQCKSKVVTEDERETSGRRAILNYGHTYGHAIEAVFGYGRYLHGQAVAIGMTCAARLARELGMVDQSFLDKQTQLLQAVGLPVDCPSEHHPELINAMKHDKKMSRGKLNLILPTRIGEVKQVPAPDDDLILQSLQND